MGWALPLLTAVTLISWTYVHRAPDTSAITLTWWAHDEMTLACAQVTGVEREEREEADRAWERIPSRVIGFLHDDRHETRHGPDTAAAPAFDAERRATELAILDALRAVVDPEIGMNVVELALIKQIILGPDSTEVKMILTTPFCPYAGSMIAAGQGAGRERRRARR